MRLVSLNVYGGNQGQLLFDYLSEQAVDADIFCFQEVFSSGADAPSAYSGAHMSGYEELQSLLPDFMHFYEPKSYGYADNTLKKAEWPVSFGLAAFVHKNIGFRECKSEVIGDGVAVGGPPLEGLIKIQILSLNDAAGKEFNVVNLHGMSRPGTKLDTPQRLEQSRKLLAILGSVNGPKVICGDFNLMPETESIRMLGKEYQDLIKEFKIQNTRNEISWKKYNNRQSFADFTFVSPEIKVKNFEVPYNLVSDHLPMELDFEL